MESKLIEHISRHIRLTDSEKNSILDFFKPVHIAKKKNLLEEGEPCRSQYFVEKGCLRLFFINDKGAEQTTQFAIENWWLADYMSYGNQQASAFYIQAVERSQVLSLDHYALEKLLGEHPEMERYFRIMYQRAYAASQFRIKYLYELSREEMYHQFISNYPGFAQRIPQYMLASFLGFTPEYLSEIRKKTFLKPV